MRSKADAETLNRLKYAGCPDLEGNLLRMTADFAFGPEYALMIWVLSIERPHRDRSDLYAAE